MSEAGGALTSGAPDSGSTATTLPAEPAPSTATRAEGRRAARRRDRTARVMAGGLLLLALVAWIGQRAANRSGDHSWNAGPPRATVHVTAGRSYDVSSRDGLRLLSVRQRTTQVRLACSYTAAGGSSGQLPVTPLAYDARILHRLGTFTAPVTGRVAIACADTGAVVVDSADDAGFDTAGALVLVTIACALAGGLLAVSAVSAGRPPTRRPDRESGQ